MVFQSFLQHVCLGMCLVSAGPDTIHFQSDRLQGLRLNPAPGEYRMQDDQNEWVSISAMQDRQGIVYWYRRIKTPVCLTGECLLVDVGIYWYCTGDFLGLEVYGHPLTKTDHSVFSGGDYDKLISVLDNDWSSLREYDFEELIEPGIGALPGDSASTVDGVSGATKKEIASEAVPDAVYTTYSLWHLAHDGEKEQLEQLTISFVNKDGGLVNELVNHQDKRYRYFLLELMALDKLKASGSLNALMMDGLGSNDAIVRNLAVKALRKADTNAPGFQSGLARVYPGLSEQGKIQILSAINNPDTLGNDFYRVLESDLNVSNESLSVRILRILRHRHNHSDKVLEVARRLTKSEHAYIRSAAQDFLRTAR